jgi:hypothetical protein
MCACGVCGLIALAPASKCVRVCGLVVLGQPVRRASCVCVCPGLTGPASENSLYVCVCDLCVRAHECAQSGCGLAQCT